jgi:hypothetical protein
MIQFVCDSCHREGANGDVDCRFGSGSGRNDRERGSCRLQGQQPGNRFQQIPPHQQIGMNCPQERKDLGARMLSPREFIMGKKRKKLLGTVEKVIKPIAASEPEKAQIGVRGADDLYREIRIENVVTDENGAQARLKPGAQVDVVVEADSDATTKKPD